MRRILIISVIMAFLLVGASAALAEETPEAWSDVTGWETPELKPMHLMLEPEIEAYLGIRVVDIVGSRRAKEYDFLHTRPVGGFRIHDYPLPHRLDVEFDFTDEKQMRAELSYMYQDIILLNYSRRGIWHNLEHQLFPEGPGAPDGSNDLNPGEDFGVGVTDNKVFLRLKWPDNPYHLFGSLRDFNKEGDIQQRYMVGRFGAGLQKYARLRNIDWDTRTYTAGANGHFGPVELQYVHGIKEFNAAKETRMMSAYPASAGRAAGTLYHNVVPDLERTWDKVEVHTSYTGRIVGSATYYHNAKKNLDNTAFAEANRATTAWTFIPFQGMTMAVRYRYDRLHVSNPLLVYERDVLTGAFLRPNPLVVDARSPSSQKHVADAIIKYSPMTGVNIKASYRFEHVNKKHIYDWHIDALGLEPPAVSQKHTAKLFAWVRPTSTIDIKAGGEYSFCTDPALPVSYRTRYAGNIKAGFTPIPELNVNAYYRLAREENPFNYPGQDANRDRFVFKDTAGMTLTYAPMSWLSTSAYYNFDRLKVKNTVTWETSDIPPVLVFTEHYVPSRDTSHVYGVTASTSFELPVNFDADFHQAISRGRYFTTAYNPAGGGFETHDIGNMVNLSLYETGGSFTTRVSLPAGFGVDLRYEINNFDDRANNPQYMALDGTAHEGTFMVRKTW